MVNEQQGESSESSLDADLTADSPSTRQRGPPCGSKTSRDGVPVLRSADKDHCFTPPHMSPKREVGKDYALVLKLSSAAKSSIQTSIEHGHNVRSLETLAEKLETVLQLTKQAALALRIKEDQETPTTTHSGLKKPTDEYRDLRMGAPSAGTLCSPILFVASDAKPAKKGLRQLLRTSQSSTRPEFRSLGGPRGRTYADPGSSLRRSRNNVPFHGRIWTS